MGNVADRLRVARERAGLSIQQISARTKIRVAALAALERGDYDQLPGGFYTRAFLKAYAREVRVPEEDILREYDEALAPVELDPAPPPMVTRPEPPTPQPSVRHDSRPPMVLRWPRRYDTPVVIALAVVLLVTLVSFSPTDTRQSAKAAAVGGAGVAEAAPTAVGTSGRVAAPDTLVIDIRPAAPVWVAATADGNSAIYRLLAPGEHVMVEAQKALSFRIGNAGAFVYSINGVPGKPLGGPDEVREFEITRENFQTYRR